ncbi:LysR substrate-binding domain-containing protein [Leifsonia sp. Root112D2]|uniref:LysR substrate-binding domain-containing protein n=1 Tax=Leifsonia sp. Root112D2 TaxID=1736426 RepID=UPI000701D49B|nr:LysR substrate-binding domain-containing protein [Leifsonia sp. Root112D2]KQV06791.1 LysR family transcriptional regulator [Leifsonia sp. Root112D2]
MELRWIEAFIAVAEELHFGRAAQRLGLAQSPLSQTIRRLERELGAPLFERSTRSVALTGAGVAFLPHARKMLGELDLAHRSVRQIEQGEYGRVTIGFSGALNHLTLPPLTRAARGRYPGIELTLVNQLVTEDAIRRLHNGEIHLAFVGLPLESPPLATRAISREPLGATLPSDHPLARRAELTVAELEGEDFVSLPVSRGSTVGENLVRACLGAGFRPRIVQEIVDPYTVLSFVAAGVGISLMPQCMQPIMPAGSVFIPLRGDVPVQEAGLAWNPDDVSPALASILALAEEILPTP